MLESLNLHSCSIGDTSVHYLAETRRRGKLPFLRALDISSNHITGVGADDLIELFLDRKFDSLRDLRLSLNDIGNVATIKIAQAFYTGHFDMLEVLSCEYILPLLPSTTNCLTVKYRS